jgi:hypothetical protein
VATRSVRHDQPHFMITETASRSCIFATSTSSFGDLGAQRRHPHPQAIPTATRKHTTHPNSRCCHATLPCMTDSKNPRKKAQRRERQRPAEWTRDPWPLPQATNRHTQRSCRGPGPLPSWLGGWTICTVLLGKWSIHPKQLVVAWADVVLEEQAGDHGEDDGYGDGDEPRVEEG